MKKLIICVDDKFGMMFNKRRQSKDKILNEKVISITSGEQLNIVSYSQSLFPDANIVESFNGVEGFCFVENPDFINTENLDEIHMFKWNRHYPADKKFDVDMSNFHMVSTEDFAGNSHENITYEIWKRN